MIERLEHSGEIRAPELDTMLILPIHRFEHLCFYAIKFNETIWYIGASEKTCPESLMSRRYGYCIFPGAPFSEINNSSRF